MRNTGRAVTRVICRSCGWDLRIAAIKRINKKALLVGAGL